MVEFYSGISPFVSYLFLLFFLHYFFCLLLNWLSILTFYFVSIMAYCSTCLSPFQEIVVLYVYMVLQPIHTLYIYMKYSTTYIYRYGVAQYLRVGCQTIHKILYIVCILYIKYYIYAYIYCVILYMHTTYKILQPTFKYYTASCIV